MKLQTEWAVKMRFSRAVQVLSCAAIVLGIMGSATLAMADPVKPAYAPPPSGSPPDLTGAWLVATGMFSVKTADGHPMPIQPWADALNKKALGDQIAYNSVDLESRCLPNGGTDVMYIPYTYFFVQTQDKIVILQEYNHQARIIYMNAAHPAKLTPTFDGHSVGHWEGNTLVVDTIGFDDQAPLMTSAAHGRGNIPRSKLLHTVERFYLSGSNKTLHDDMWIDDPKVFTRPWTSLVTYAWRPDLRPFEDICAENNKPQGLR